MERIQKNKQSQTEKTVEELPVDSQKEAADLTATDELLDEIDAVLEHNAAEFVRDYVQKGGQ